MGGDELLHPIVEGEWQTLESCGIAENSTLELRGEFPDTVNVYVDHNRQQVFLVVIKIFVGKWKRGKWKRYTGGNLSIDEIRDAILERKDGDDVYDTRFDYEGST